MKKLKILVLCVLVTLLFSSCGKKDETGSTGSKEKEKTSSTETKKDDVKSSDVDYNTPFHIKYENKVKDRVVVMDIYRKGDKAKSETDMTGAKAGKITSYILGKTVYTITEVAGKKFAMKTEMKNTGGEENVEDIMKNFKDVLKDMEKTGSENIIGYKCDIYKNKDGVEYYLYKDMIPLKIVTKQGSSMEAKELELNVKLDDSFFEIPKDVEFKETKPIDMSKFKKN